MFPEKVGRMIIDSVVDPTVFAADTAALMRSSVTHLDSIIESFGTECEEAGPGRCALAEERKDKEVSNTQDKKKKTGYVLSKIENLIDELAKRPLPVPNAPVPITITATNILGALFSSSYSPIVWPRLAEALNDLITTKNATSFIQVFSRVIGAAGGPGDICPLFDEPGDNGFSAVKCNDGIDESHMTIEEWDAEVLKTEAVSKFGGRLFHYPSIACVYWPARPVERYAGPWNKTLANRIVVMGNVKDPVTPYESAQKVYEMLGENSAALVKTMSYGHAFSSQASTCNLKVIRDYYVDGVLPEKGKTCYPDDPIFPEKNTQDTLVSMTAQEKLKKDTEEIHDVLMDMKRGGGFLF
jgi:hypothetical protein